MRGTPLLGLMILLAAVASCQPVPVACSPATGAQTEAPNRMPCEPGMFHLDVTKVTGHTGGPHQNAWLAPLD